MKIGKTKRVLFWVIVLLCFTMPGWDAETFAAPILYAEANGVAGLVDDACIKWIAPVTGFHSETEKRQAKDDFFEQLEAENEAARERSLTKEEMLQANVITVEEIIKAENEPGGEESGDDAPELSQESPENEGDEGIDETQTPEMMQKIREISLENVEDFDALVRQFYVIDSTTMADEKLLNPEKFWEKDVSINKDGEGPQILIYHTHSQEAFLDSAEGDPDQTVVGVGEELTRILQDNYGYQVLHHLGVYDKPSRNGAYSRALPEIQRILEENPSIRVVIDLHRDEMPKNVRLVTEIDGKKTARFMFFNGISRTRKTGELEYLKNEFLEDNLAFSFQMEKAAQEYYPNLTRKIYLKGYRYNMHLSPRTLLIELGAQNNTLEEAMNACEPLAKVLDLVLSGKNK